MSKKSFNEAKDNVEKRWAKSHPVKGQVKSVQFGEKKKEGKLYGFSEALLEVTK